MRADDVQQSLSTIIHALILIFVVSVGRGHKGLAKAPHWTRKFMHPHPAPRTKMGSHLDRPLPSGTRFTRYMFALGGDEAGD